MASSAADAASSIFPACAAGAILRREQREAVFFCRTFFLPKKKSAEVQWRPGLRANSVLARWASGFEAISGAARCRPSSATDGQRTARQGLGRGPRDCEPRMASRDPPSGHGCRSEGSGRRHGCRRPRPRARPEWSGAERRAGEQRGVRGGTPHRSCCAKAWMPKLRIRGTRLALNRQLERE